MSIGRLDILVNNAGIAPGAPASSVSEENFDATLQVIWKGPFSAGRSAGNIVGQAEPVGIINIGPQAGLVALPGESIYCMTKAAIGHFAKCLAVEWGVLGITTVELRGSEHHRDSRHRARVVGSGVWPTWSNESPPCTESVSQLT